VRATLALVSAGLIAAAVVEGTVTPLVTAALGAALFGGLLFLVHLISPGSMGFGDVRLAIVLGAVLGWYGVNVLLWGVLLGDVLGVVVGMAAGLARRRLRGVRIAFGPPLIAGALLSILIVAPATVV
jgi:leader peptidase (prepilin peptidase)/N-methyltransferase